MSGKSRATRTRTLLPLGVVCVEDWHLLGHELRLGTLTDGTHEWRDTVRVTTEPNSRPDTNEERAGGSEWDEIKRRLLCFYGRSRNTTDERRGESFAPHQFTLTQPIAAHFERGLWTTPPNADEVAYWAAVEEAAQFVAACEAIIADNAWAFSATPRLRIRR